MRAYEEQAMRAQAALEAVQRYQIELRNCTNQLEMIDGSTSDQVARHPAFRRMRGSVEQKMQVLHQQLLEATAVYEHEAKAKEAAEMAVRRARAAVAEEPPQEEMDLTPLLKDALDNLWARPYDCRVFTLQLLQAMAELDDRSVCMMSSCFARYIETHSTPSPAQ